MITEKNRKAYRLFLRWDHRVNNEESRKVFIDRYRGEFDTEADYARSFYESTPSIVSLTQWARDNLNWDSIAKEMFSTDFYSIASANECFVYVFSRN